LFLGSDGIDVRMASPPPIDSNGASRTTGGILRGRAQGNVFNHADGVDQIYVGPRMGKVFVYQSPRVPDSKNSETSIKCEVTPQIKPVLKALARRFSPVSSKSYFLTYVQQKKNLLC
jgi:hypothetical protein